MSDFLPTQPPGPGPTDAPLPTYQSYSPVQTSIYDFTTEITRIAFDPQETFPPSVVVETQIVHTTSVQYSVVNLPLSSLFSNLQWDWGDTRRSSLAQKVLCGLYEDQRTTRDSPS